VHTGAEKILQAETSRIRIPASQKTAEAQEIKEHLDQYVIGQDRAKKVLSVLFITI